MRLRITRSGSQTQKERALRQQTGALGIFNTVRKKTLRAFLQNLSSRLSSGSQPWGSVTKPSFNMPARCTAAITLSTSS